MTTTAESLRRHILKVFRVTTCVILGLLLGTLTFAEDGSPTRVTHILGLEGVANNASGTLSIQKDALQFHKDPGLTAQISVGSITNISVGEQDRQVGGVPMALGEAATPFGGGRVISLFSHKKYDTLTVEYLDSKGGLHGVIFQLSKGNAEVIKKALLADGARVAQPENHGAKVRDAEIMNENK
jgi:hypothetical protein